MQPIRRIVSRPPFEGTAPVFGAEFTFTADPARPIEGVVRDAKTGELIAGVSVESYKLVGYPYSNNRVLKAKTDKHGRFRLTGMPKGSGNRLLIVPNDDQPYFMDVAGKRLLHLQCHFGLDTITWGGFLARFHKGSRIMMEQTRVNDEVWLPRQVTGKIDVRFALVKNFNVGFEQSFRDYKKFRTSTRIIGMGAPEEQK